MFDLQLLAFQSDLTRVISFMISKEQSARPYPQIGVPEAHHPLSHHGDTPELVEHMSKINRLSHAAVRPSTSRSSRATPDGDGSLLDHTTILYGSGISNSNAHSGDNLPLLARRRRRGPPPWRPASRLQGRTLDGQPAGHTDGQARRARRPHRRQHRASCRSTRCQESSDAIAPASGVVAVAAALMRLRRLRGR